MEAVDSQRRAEMLATYQHFRNVSRPLSSKLVASLGKEAIEESGRRLGILRRGILCFDTEDAAAVLMDYAIHHVRRDGVNAVERYLADSPPPPDSDEMTLLRAMYDVRCGLFQVEEVYRDSGVRVSDVLRDEAGLLLDVGFSQTAKRGFVLASHVLSPGDFWMTTGAALPVSAGTLGKLAPQIERRFGRGPQDFRTLSRQQHTQLATLIIRTCLEEGMSQRIAYGEPHFGRRHRPHAVPEPKTVRVGRNDPCPCGSGRKYKHCCRR